MYCIAMMHIAVKAHRRAFRFDLHDAVPLARALVRAPDLFDRLAALRRGCSTPSAPPRPSSRART
jgi:hypothetical protein